MQDLDRLVDRVRREGSQDAAVVVAQRLAALDRAAAQVGLFDLVAAVGVDGLDVDRVDRPVGEVGQQVRERPLLVVVGVRADLALAGRDEPARERPEERHLRRGAVRRRCSAAAVLVGWDPDAAADVGEDVLQLLLGALAGPALGLQAEGEVLALAVGGEAQGVAAPALPCPLEDLPLI